MAEWRKHTTFERNATLMTIIGETGISHRPKIIPLSSVGMELKPDNSAISNAIHLIEKRGLIERSDMFEKQQRWRSHWRKAVDHFVHCDERSPAHSQRDES